MTKPLTDVEGTSYETEKKKTKTITNRLIFYKVIQNNSMSIK